MKRLVLLILATCLLCGCVMQSAGPTQFLTESTANTTTPSTDTVTIPTETMLPTQPLEPETVSILDFLRIAAQPVGSTMYVWGGGWNEEDTAAGVEAVTLGVSARWAEFAAEQDSSYDYNKTRYQIHDGLDCSGYVGWAVYNALETENGGSGYVWSSTQVARNLADLGLGEFIPVEQLTEWLPGDVMSMKGHCWLVIGMCDDDSVLLLHSSPPGVRFCGTALADGSNSQAVALAEKIMAQHYPDWYSRYPDCAVAASYLEKSSAMRWSTEVLSDNENLRKMSAEEVAAAIFGQ